MRYLKVDDGTTWPRPGLESDDETDVAWKLTYAPHHMTREDQLLAASIIGAYGRLVCVPSAAKQLPAVRRALRESGTR